LVHKRLKTGPEVLPTITIYAIASGGLKWQYIAIIAIFSSCNYFVVVAKGTYRLVGCGSTRCRQGRLEVWATDTWGTVCDDAFDDRDAQVACYSLGFG